MDKVEKFLRKLSKKEQKMFLLLIVQLHKDYTSIPGIKALVGKEKVFRIRVGIYRVIFKVYTKKNVEIIKISKRDNRTYKDI